MISYISISIAHSIHGDGNASVLWFNNLRAFLFFSIIFIININLEIIGSNWYFGEGKENILEWGSALFFWKDFRMGKMY